MSLKQSTCVFCSVNTLTRGHHLIPKCKDGNIIVDTCETCESFIHKTWTHNELRNIYNTIELIKQTEKFKKFLKWKLKQPKETVFKSCSATFRNKNKYS